jgi:Tol biopolymer transport system component
MFVRLVTDEVGAYWIADADGSNARELVPAPVDWFEWSSTGDRIVLTRLTGAPATSIVRVEDGTVTPLDVGIEIRNPVWRPNRDQIVFSSGRAEGHVAYYVVDADGTDLREIDGVSPDAINDPVLSPDGSSIAYTTWADGDGMQGRIHIVDIDSGRDRLMAIEGSDGTNEFAYQFSPDGTKLLLERHGIDPSYEVNGVPGYRLVVVPADGGGPAVPIGPAMPPGTDGATAEFSPDGTQVLATYRYDRSTWLLDVTGGMGEPTEWNADAQTWQRLAP